MKKLLHKTAMCVVIMFALMLSGFAETTAGASVASQKFITVKGSVFSSDGEPLTGAAVYPKGHNEDGVIADLDGKFTITVQEGTVLVFSYLGFEEKELPARSKMNIVLSPDRLLMDEAVVVGYSKQKIRDISASVARVDMENLEYNQTASLATMLAGQAAGIQTVTRSGVPGASGSGIVIRGNNSLSSANDITGISNPLYIIDGIPMALQDFAGFNVTDNDFLSTLNTQDIQSIDILKDAAATAIYGSRGANGVVIITTRKGTSGAPRVNARASYGVISRPSKLPVYVGDEERQAKIALINQTLNNLFDEGMEWIDVRHNKEILGYALPAVLTDKYNPAFNNAYDYQDMFYQSGTTQNYDLSLEGGAESSSYRVSLGHYREKGVLVGYGLNRTTLNTSLITDLNRFLHNELIMRYTYLDRQGGLNDAMKAMPTSPTDLPSSLYYRTDEELKLLSGQLGDAYNKNRSHQLTVGETLRIKFMESLSLDTQVSMVMDFGKRDYFIPATAKDDGMSEAHSLASMTTTVNGNSVLNYNQAFGRNKQHGVVGLLGVEVNSNTMNSLTAQAIDGMSDYLKVIKGYKKEDTEATSDIVRTNMFSMFAMLSYGYAQNRYKVEAVFRRDASSRFGANNKWANFPSIKAHWAFSEEPWMKATKSWMDFGKVRVSYGTSGDIYYDPLLQYNSLIALNSYYGVGALLTDARPNKMDVKTYGTTLSLVSDFNKIANLDLSWSRSKEIDYGLDLELFNHRLYLSADLYSKYMSGLVYTSELPAYVGYSSLSSNLVDMVSSGFEVSLTGYLFPRKSAVQWDWTINLAKNSTKIAKLGNGGRDYINVADKYAFIEGAPAFQYFMYEYQGTLDNFKDLPVNPFTGNPLSYTLADAGLARNMQGRIFPGMPVFTDVNGDYVISGYEEEADMKIIEGKTPEPKITGGLSTKFRWKGLTVNVNSSFALGHWIYNTTLQSQLSRFDSDWAFYRYGLYKFDDSKFWSGPDDGSYYPMILVNYADGGSARSFRHSSMFLERGDYWSLDNVTISYDLPSRWMDSIKLRGINLYVTGQNLAMWKASSVFDPRMVDRRGWYNGQGYPISRTFIFGVQLQF